MALALLGIVQNCVRRNDVSAAQDLAATSTSGSGSASRCCSCRSRSRARSGLARSSRRAGQSGPLCGDGRASRCRRPTLLQRAAAALGRAFEPAVVRMPESAGWPATVTAREQRRGEGGGRPRLLTVYLDPPTGRVLDVVEFRNSLIGFLHRFHENLTIPEYSGRAIVGWAASACSCCRSAASICGGRATPASCAGCAGARTCDVVQPASSVRLLDFDSARRRVGDRHLSRLSAAGAGTAVFGRADDAAAARRLQCAAAAADRSSMSIARWKSQQWAHGRFARRRGLHADATEPGPGAFSCARGQSESADDGDGRRSQRRADAGEPQSGDRIAQWIRWIHEGSHSGHDLAGPGVSLRRLADAVSRHRGTMIWLRSRKAKRARDAESQACRRSMRRSDDNDHWPRAAVNL